MKNKTQRDSRLLKIVIGCFSLVATPLLSAVDYSGELAEVEALGDLDAGPNLVVNGSFEQPDVAVGGFLQLRAGSSSLTGWTISDSAQKAAVGGVTVIDHWSEGGNISPAPEGADGDQLLLLQHSAGDAGVISQSITTEVGETYTLEFECGGVYPTAWTKTLNYSVNGLNRSVSITSQSGRSQAAWVNEKLEFTATEATTTITFTGDYAAGFWGMGIDDVRVTKAPPAMYVGDSLAAARSSVSAGELKSVYFDGQDYQGKATRVYAWVGIPAGASAENPAPAMVLVHGGGGTAHKDWVAKWLARGYAAISVAVEGQTDWRENGAWYKHAMAGPKRVGTYGDGAVRPISDQWMYHAVADCVLANTLIRSFPEVDEDLVGLSGFSWGGVITSTVIGIDNRFKFAIPTYGCGHLSDSRNHYGRALGNNETYKNVWDPMLRMDKATMPVLWFSWPEEPHFQMDSLAYSYHAAAGKRMVSLKPRMGHGGNWHSPEYYDFADSIVYEGAPWCEQQSLEVVDNSAAVVFRSSKNLQSAILVHTTGNDEITGGIDTNLVWLETPLASPVQQNDGTWSVSATLPSNVTAWFINVKAAGSDPNNNYGYNDVNLTASSDYQEVNRLSFKPANELAFEFSLIEGAITQSVDMSYTGAANVEVSAISISNESHAGAFTSLTAAPLVMHTPTPNVTPVSVHFDNAIAGLVDGEFASATLTITWDKLDGTTEQAELPIVAYAKAAVTIAYEEDAQWGSKDVNDIDSVILRNDATVVVGEYTEQSLVVNGSFENPDVPADNDNGASGFSGVAAGSSALTGWTVSGSNVYVIDGFDRFDASSDALASDGQQFVQLQYKPNAATISQQINTKVGATYELSFDYGALGFSDTHELVLSYSCGSESHSLEVTTGNPQSPWQNESVRFVASSELSEISFTGASLNGFYGPSIDNVKVIKVTEPNLIANGSFEQRGISPSQFSSVSANSGDLTNWEVSASGVVLINGFDNFGSWSATVAAEGEQYLQLQTWTPSAGAGEISQSFETKAGSRYQLSFDYSGIYPALKDTSIRYDLGGDEYSVSVSMSSAQAEWQTESIVFTATDSTTTLRFTGELLSGFWGASLDDVKVVELPAISDIADTLIVNDQASPTIATLQMDEDFSLTFATSIELGAGTGAGFVNQSAGSVATANLIINSSASGDLSSYNLSGGELAIRELTINDGGEVNLTGGKLLLEEGTGVAKLSGNSILNIDGGMLLKDFAGETPASTLQSSGDQSRILMQSGSLQLVNGTVHSVTNLGSKLEISGGDVDLISQVRVSNDFKVMGDLATIDIGWLGTFAGSHFTFEFDESGVTPVNVASWMSLGSAELTVDGSSYNGGSGVFTLFDSINLASKFDPAKVNVTGFAEKGFDVTLVQDDTVEQRVSLVIQVSAELALNPSDSLSMDHQMGSGKSLANVDLSFTGPETLEITSIVISSQSHEGAFSSLTTAPLVLNGPSPESSPITIQFDNQIAGLVYGEYANAVLTVTREDALSGNVDQIQLPISASAQGEMTVVYDSVADWTSKPVSYVDEVILRDGAEVSIDGNQPNLIENGSFEQPALAANQFNQLLVGDSSLLGWTIEDAAQNPEQGVTVVSDWVWGGQPDVTNVASEGANFLQLQSFKAAGVISQEFATVVGATYQLSFDFNAIDFSSRPVNIHYSVGAGDEVVSFTSKPSAENWASETVQFVASASTTTLSFGGEFFSGFFGVGIDNVSVKALPVADTVIVNDEASPSVAILNVDQDVTVPVTSSIKLGVGTGVGVVNQSSGLVITDTVEVNASGTGELSKYNLSGGTLSVNNRLAVNASGAFNLTGGELLISSIGAVSDNGLINIDGGKLLKDFNGSSLASTLGDAADKGEILIQSGALQLVNGTEQTTVELNAKLVISGGDVDVAAQLVNNNEIKVIGALASVDVASLSSQTECEFGFQFDANGVSPVNVASWMELANGSLTIDGSAYNGGSGVFTLLDSNYLISKFEPSKISVTGFSEAGWDVTVVQDDVVEERVCLVIQESVELHLTPSGSLAIEHHLEQSQSTATVALSFTGPESIEITGVAISNESHLGAFECVTPVPFVLTEQSPTTSALTLKFDNTVAKLGNGDTASASLVVTRVDQLSGVTDQVQLPLSVNAVDGVIVAYAATSTWSSKAVEGADDVFIRNDAAVTLDRLPSNLLVNGSFESPDINQGEYATFSPSTAIDSNWVVESGNVTVVDRWDGAVASEGQQFLQLQGSEDKAEGPAKHHKHDHKSVGTISQSFATTVGEAYVLSFDHSALNYNSRPLAITYHLGGEEQMVKISKWHKPAQKEWQSERYEFVASQELTTLTLTGTWVKGFYGPSIDNLSIESVWQDPAEVDTITVNDEASPVVATLNIDQDVILSVRRAMNLGVGTGAGIVNQSRGSVGSESVSVNCSGSGAISEYNLSGGSLALSKSVCVNSLGLFNLTGGELLLTGSAGVNVNGSGLLKINGGRLSKDYSTETVAGTFGSSTDNGKIQLQSGSLQLLNGTAESELELYSPLEVSGGDLDISAQLVSHAELTVIGESAEIDIESLVAAYGSKFNFQFSEAGVSAVNVRSSMSLANASVTIDGSAYLGGSAIVPLLSSTELRSAFSTNNITVTGFDADSLDVSIVQDAESVYLVIVQYVQNVEGTDDSTGSHKHGDKPHHGPKGKKPHGKHGDKHQQTSPDTSVLSVQFVRENAAYAIWVANAGLSGADVNISADPDRDERENLFEYAFGSSPVTKTKEQVWLSIGAKSLITTRRIASAAGISYVLEESASKKHDSWSAVENFSEEIISIEGGFETVEITNLSDELSGKKKMKYLRLNVILAE